ncbi:hypothetical protein G3I40_12285 [Streptomyces sp. SID14478]|uniref:hypothetical protein n=1 Tax=Streptomyces sp. SID14478 TaxID=2706073 RepID=UPI0013DB8AF7|nr:hypothetical protein [Streptomyces sp. SID14478]NEB75993.1 hypothetical protein [Streptomyces sp. SID14478]
MHTNVEFVTVGSLCFTATADRPPLPVDEAAVRISRARDVSEGDLILAVANPQHPADYFNTPYTARPELFDPACGCGACELVDPADGESVVLSNGDPWDSCDPWPAYQLALIVPAALLPAAHRPDPEPNAGGPR